MEASLILIWIHSFSSRTGPVRQEDFAMVRFPAGERNPACRHLPSHFYSNDSGNCRKTCTKQNGVSSSSHQRLGCPRYPPFQGQSFFLYESIRSEASNQEEDELNQLKKEPEMKLMHRAWKQDETTGKSPSIGFKQFSAAFTSS